MRCCGIRFIFYNPAGGSSCSLAVGAKGYLCMYDKSQSYTSFFIFLYQLIDASIGAGLFWALNHYLATFDDSHLQMAVIIFFVTLVCFQLVGLYRSWRIASTARELEQIVGGCFTLYLVLLWVSFLLGIIEKLSYQAVLTWMVILPMVLCAVRYSIRIFLRYLRMRGYNVRKAVIVGSGELSGKLARLIDENPWAGTLLLGYFSDAPAEDMGQEHKWLGDLSMVSSYVQRNELDVIYSTLPMCAAEKIQSLLAELSEATLSFYIVPDVFFVDLITGANVIYFDNLPIIALRDTPLQGVNLFLKRAEDLVLASMILLLTSPLMLVIATAIRFFYGRPVFFTQWRYGLNGQAIKIYKFRTMNVCEDGYAFTQATACDPRVTRLGAFLRRTSLDELPQFINVLQGRMSMVGPRPHPVAMNEKYRKIIAGYMLRHKIKPGITGLAQINGMRGETETPGKIEKRIEFDLEYLRQWSLFLDLKIIFVTIWQMLWRGNVY